jgi:hypothetical protein
MAEPNLITLCRRVKANSSAEKLNWTDANGKRRKTLIDGMSANLAVSCWDTFKPENREKFAALADRNPVGAINILWKIAK